MSDMKSNLRDMKRKKSKRFGWMVAAAIMGLFGAGISRGFVIGEFDFGILEDEPGRVDVALSPGDKTRDSLIVPETVVIEGKEYRVKKVREYGFESVVTPYLRLPESMSLCRYAFLNARVGEFVVEGDQLDSVGLRAFESFETPRFDCNILPPDYSKIAKWYYDTYHLFHYAKIDDVVWSSRLTEIGDCMFVSAHIQRIYFPSTLRSIEDGAFAFCKIDSIAIPDNVNIKGESFLGAYNIRNLELGKGCEIHEDAFFANIAARRLVIPSGTIVYRGAFNTWSQLEVVEVADDVEFKGLAFYGADFGTLESWFHDDTKIKYEKTKPLTVIYHTSDPREYTFNIFEDDTYDAGCLYVEDDGVEKARQTRPWSKFKIILPLSQYNGVEGVTPDGRPDGDWPEEVFTLDGTRVPGRTDALPPGTYIVRRGPKVTKLRI